MTKQIELIKNTFAQQQDFASWDEMLDQSNGSIYNGMVDGVLEVALKKNTGEMQGQVTGKSAGKFVNASECTPAHDQRLHVKIDGIRRMGNFFQEDGEDFFYVSGALTDWILPRSKFGGIEWLDENSEAGKLPEQQPSDRSPLWYMEYVLHEYFKWEAYPKDIAESRAKEYASKFHSWLQNKQEVKNDSE